MTDIQFSSWGEQIVDNRGKKAKDFKPIENVSLPEEFKQNETIKALIGWYGIITRSDEVNMVDLCRSYMTAVHNHSCGRCMPCRMGPGIMAQILERLCEGQGQPGDLDQLEQLAGFIRESSKCNIGQSGPYPILHALKHFAEDFQKAVASKEAIPAGSYHSKLTAPCSEACPIHLDIPTYVERIREGNFMEALNVIREKLPIPGIVGRVCVRPCEENCRRANMDDPISIKYLKRFVADEELARGQEPTYEINPAPKTGKVAIIGAGPGGVTCAYHLASRGHQVTIYEQWEEPGGMAATVIPDYRLPRPILRHEVELVQKMGITIHYGTSIGKDIKLSQLENDFDAVFIAIGAQDSSSMRVEGEDEGYEGFIPGVQYLKDINEGRDPYPEGKKIVAVGGGNVAIDCVRCSRRFVRAFFALPDHLQMGWLRLGLFAPRTRQGKAIPGR